VIELRVPALRERCEDIRDLATVILRRLCRRLNTAAPQLDAHASEALQLYAFPGNVRELENILERALTLCAGGIITAENLRLRSETRLAPEPGAIPSARGALGAQLEDIERDAIVKALEKTRYNKTAAAKLLGISFRALRYRIKKLGIE
jgi:two-component system response regulator PilR (NtrC family)